jgi:outer membrane protein assembly factor BamD
VTIRNSRLASATQVGAAIALAAALFVSACGGKKNTIPPGTVQPDKFLYDRGMASLSDKKWFNAREYLRQVVDNYPQSPVRPDAKLGLGDSYLGEGTTESYVLAINEYREFLTYYPTNARADYAQYRLAYAHYKQMLGPERDQTETREAAKEFEAFVERYPNSALMPEAKARLRETKDRLDDSEYRVGFFYFRVKWYPGAIDRFKALLKSDPEYTRRDSVYFYLAESLLKTEKKAEALPYYERLVEEFQSSEHLEDAKRRITELKAQSGAGTHEPVRAALRPFAQEQAHDGRPMDGTRNRADVRRVVGSTTDG